MRGSYLYLDLGFILSCNLVCTYCRRERIDGVDGFQLAHFREQLGAFKARYQAACLKMSGYGEVTRWADFDGALALAAESFPKVQIITNGTFSLRVREVLLSFENVSPNLTIDGHTPEMNVLRTGGAVGNHKRMLQNLWALARAGRRVELNCVVHKHNVAGLRDYCAEIAEEGWGNVLFFPFPVKQFGLADGYEPLSCDPVVARRQLLACLRDFPSVMPPETYVLDFIRFLEEGRRREACHVHWANIGSGGRNERLHCPNYGEDLSHGPMTEVLRDEPYQVREVEARNLARGGVGPGCAQCFNHFHVVNLWLDGKICTDDILRMPSLDAPGVRAIAERVLAEFSAARA